MYRSPRCLPTTWLLALVVGLAACAPTARPQPAAPAPASPAQPVAQQPAAAPTAAPTAAPARAAVGLGVIGGSSDAAIFLAVDKDYFAEQGLDVDLQPFRSAAEMIPALGAGQLEVGGGTPSAGLFNAIGRGIPIRIVADRGCQSPGHGYEGLVVRRDLVQEGRFHDLADLRGATVAFSAQGSSGEIVLDTALAKLGLSTRDLNAVVMGFPDMPAALAGGSVDAAMLIEPFLVSAVDKDLGVVWRRSDELSPDFQAAVLLYGPAIVQEPDVARRFMLAYVKATRYYNQAVAAKGSPAWQELVDVLIRHTSVKDRALYERIVLPGIDPDAAVNVESLRASQDWFVERGLQQEKIDLAQALDPSYARAAASQLGPAPR